MKGERKEIEKLTRWRKENEKIVWKTSGKRKSCEGKMSINQEERIK